MRRRVSIVLLLALAFGLLALPQPSAAQQRTRCFAETGHCISGAILTYWERNGGLPVFGYPITDLRTETIEGSWTGPVQWFERDRLEDHGAQGVMAGRLGARYLELRSTPWTEYPKASRVSTSCVFFQETGHSLCEPFLSYWRQNGGLARFGYPITEPFVEQIGSWSGVVQYFERRRMERHSELAGTPYEILLGLLGSNVQQAEQAGCPGSIPATLRPAVFNIPFRDAMGCPRNTYADIPAAVQNFEHGMMIWVNQGDGGKKIIVIYNPGVFTDTFIYTVRDDTWTEGELVSEGLTPPPGRYEPVRGFGKIWRGSRGARQFIGWATEPERAETATVQYFEKGLLLRLHITNTVYAFGPDSNQTLQVWP